MKAKQEVSGPPAGIRDEESTGRRVGDGPTSDGNSVRLGVRAPRYCEGSTISQSRVTCVRKGLPDPPILDPDPGPFDRRPEQPSSASSHRSNSICQDPFHCDSLRCLDSKRVDFEHGCNVAFCRWRGRIKDCSNAGVSCSRMMTVICARRVHLLLEPLRRSRLREPTQLRGGQAGGLEPTSAKTGPGRPQAAREPAEEIPTSGVQSRSRYRASVPPADRPARTPQRPRIPLAR